MGASLKQSEPVMKTIPLPQNIPELTSLRFIAAAIVMAFHYALAFAPDALAATGILGKGNLGVDFFFVLSGFILMHVYCGAHEAGRFHYLDFLWARLARIYPLHLATTLIAIVVLLAAFKLGGIKDDPVYADFVVKTLLMVHAWGTVDHFGLNAPSWSISAEWAAYLAFPLFLGVAMALRARPLAFTATAVAALFGADALARATIGKGVTDLSYDFGILRIGAEFLFGCALHALARSLILSSTGSAAALAISGVATLVLLHLRAPDLLVVLAMGGVILAAALRARAAPGPRALAHPALVYLGEISYAVYLTHRLVEYAIVDLLGPLTGFTPTGLTAIAIAVPATLAAAAALHHAIERPARALLRGAPPSSWSLRLAGAQRN
jgi:peptidoglycan/LPS O-acetylase OafA/YrhL